MSLAEKQEFLKKSISKGGNKQAKFVALLEKNKEKKSDLAKWSMDELKKLAEEFNGKYEGQESDDESSISSLDSDDEQRVFGGKKASKKHEKKD
jgi:hypothetical protein